MLKYIYKFGIYPVKLYWFLFRPSGFGVKCIIQRADGKILLVTHTYGKGTWNIPGGGIEKGETSEQAAIREVGEEVGITLERVEKIGSFISTREYKKDHVDVFMAHTDSKIGGIDHNEIKSAQWFDRNHLPQPLSEIVQQSLALLGSR